MLICNCGRTFKTQQGLDKHKPYCKGKRYCQNPECGILLTKPDQNKFCCASCCVKMTGKGRKHSEETKKKISNSLGGSGKRKAIVKNCLYCGNNTTNPKYCSFECSRLSRIPFNYENKNYIARKEILWVEQKQKCNKCSFNLHDYKDGPYEIHHFDGNSKNHKRENEELLCCNCHFLTDNYRFKGRKHTKESKNLMSNNYKKPY